MQFHDDYATFIIISLFFCDPIIKINVYIIVIF